MSILNFIHWNPEPNLLDTPFFIVRWYSLLFGLGFVISYVLLKRYFFNKQTPIFLLDRLTIYVFFGTVIGARLGHCLFYDFDYYRHHIVEIFFPFQFSPHFKFIGFQGLASHGGAIGILTAIWLYSRKYHTPFLRVADRLAMVVPIAGCCIRLGNLMNSEIIGKKAWVSWAFVFERVDLFPRHPSQLYEAIAYLLVALLMVYFGRSDRRKNGYLFGWFLVLVFSFRFIIEFTKEDQAAFEAHMPLNMGQLLSVPLILTGLVIIIKTSEKDQFVKPMVG